MNKLISTKNRVYISLIGPSSTWLSQHVYNWLKIGTPQPKFANFFYQLSQPLYDVMQKEIEKLEFDQGVNFEIVASLKTTVPSTCWSWMIFVKRFAIQKRLLILLLLEDMVDSALFTLTTTCFKKANLGKTLSSRTGSLFSSSLPVMWCGSEVVDWYRNETSVPYGQKWFDLPPRTDDWLRYCTNTGSLP